MDRAADEGRTHRDSAAAPTPAPHLSRAALARVAGIAAAPLLLAGLGATHPARLTAETAGWWRDLHLLLIPLFPLLGVNVWWLLVGLAGPLPWLGRAAGFVYIAFYGALDVLAGVGTAVIRDRAGQEGRPDLLAEVGVWAFLLGCLVASGLLIARAGRRAAPGAVLLCGAAVVFLRSHIYFPVGVATMLAMAAGFGLLQWARLRPPGRRRPRPTRVSGAGAPGLASQVSL